MYLFLGGSTHSNLNITGSQIYVLNFALKKETISRLQYCTECLIKEVHYISRHHLQNNP